MLAMRELTVLSIVVRILLAIGLGGIIGLERGMKNRAAGLRTYMLVSLGACIVMITNLYIYMVYDTGDPVRMGAQVVSGIGFLGAGSIIVTARNQIKGLTTAAGLWASACVGLAIGIGLYEVALIGGACIFIILTVLHNIDDKLHRSAKRLDAYIELEKGVPISVFFDFIHTHDIEHSNLHMDTDGAYTKGSIAFSVTLKSKGEYDHEDMLRALESLEGTAYVETL